MHQAIQTTIQEVESSFPSLYSKEDVVAILGILDTQLKRGTLKEYRDKFLSDVRVVIEKLPEDEVVDFDSIELSLDHHNRITVESLTIDYDVVINAIEEVFDSLKVD